MRENRWLAGGKVVSDLNHLPSGLSPMFIGVYIDNGKRRWFWEAEELTEKEYNERINSYI